MPVAAIGLGLGLVSSIGKMISAGKANSQLNTLVTQNPAYKPNPIAQQRLGLATALLNARAPGVASAEANIGSAQATQQENIGRNATSGAQVIAAGAGAQGTANRAYEGLNEQEAQDYQRRYGNVSEAQQGVIQEGDKAFQDQVRRFQDLAQIRGAQNANRQNAWQSLSNLGFSSLNFGLAGGFKKLFPTGGTNPNQPSATPDAQYSPVNQSPVWNGGQIDTPSSNYPTIQNPYS